MYLLGMNIRYSLIALALLMGASFATDPRFEQGARFLAQGEYEKALGEYRAVLAEQPQNSDAYFAAAEVYIKMPKPDYSRALANYRLAYKFTPTMSAAYEGAAKVYEKLGQKSKAEAELAKDPKNRPAEEAAPVAEAAAPSVAAPAAETAAAPQPAPAQAAAPVQEPAPAQPAQTAAAPVATQEPAQAAPAPAAPASAAQAPAPATTQQAAPVNPDDPFEKGKAFLAEGKFEDAAKMWREVLKKTPGHVGAYYYAGVTRLKMGEYDKAEFNLKKGQDYKEAGADVHYYLALVYKAQNKTDLEKKSLAAYAKKSGPKGEFRKDVEARLAELKNASADTATAAAATAAAPAQDAAASADEATVADAKAAPAIAPAPAKAYSIARANDLFKAGSFEEALQVYKVMLETEISPDERYFALLQMGNIYRELRDFHSAASRYREVVQQYPDSDWATEAERALEDAVWLENHASELPRRMR